MRTQEVKISSSSDRQHYYIIIYTHIYSLVRENRANALPCVYGYGCECCMGIVIMVGGEWRVSSFSRGRCQVSSPSCLVISSQNSQFTWYSTIKSIQQLFIFSPSKPVLYRCTAVPTNRFLVQHDRMVYLVCCVLMSFVMHRKTEGAQGATREHAMSENRVAYTRI